MIIWTLRMLLQFTTENEKLCRHRQRAEYDYPLRGYSDLMPTLIGHRMRFSDINKAREFGNLHSKVHGTIFPLFTDRYITHTKIN